MNRIYNDDELIRRVWDVEEIKKLAHKRVYYQINQWSERELEELWTRERRESASFGANTGFYVTLDSIRKWYATRPSGTGVLSCYPVSTGLVELAGDGRTAKGLWYCIGQETVPGKATWITGKVAMDFVKENGAWKIWHVVEANDLSSGAGENYSEGEPYWDPASDPVVKAFGTPDIPVLTHDPNFNWWDDYPAMPEPYDTWDDAFSYGPEGFRAPKNKGFCVGEGRNYK